MNKLPLVTVIVPHYNDLAGLDLCLTALCDQQGVPRDQYEIVICDNDSPVGLREVESVVDGRGRVVQTKTRGAGPARNEAVTHAKGRLLAFTDSDCVPDVRWLASGIEKVTAGSIVGGKMVVSVADEKNLSGAEAFERVFAFNNRRYVEREGFSVTANLFCEKASFDRVGPFRVNVSEDKEWCQRAVALGYSLDYAANAIVSHPARPDWPSLVRKWERIDLETFNLLMEGSSLNRLKWLVKAWLLLISIVPHGVVCFHSDTIAGPKQRVLAIRTLARIRIWRFWHYHSLLLTKPESLSPGIVPNDSKK